MPDTAPPRIAELRAARARMVATRERILGSVKDLTREDLLRVPQAGGWCAAELLDHLLTAESKLVKGLTKLERGEPIRLPRRCWYYRLPMGIAFLDVKLKAPRPVRPHAAAEIEPATLLEKLAASRRALLEFADRLGEERYSRFIFPHFLLGRFDGLDWFNFVGRHETRHAAQLERILTTSAPPAR